MATPALCAYAEECGAIEATCRAAFAMLIIADAAARLPTYARYACGVTMMLFALMTMPCLPPACCRAVTRRRLSLSAMHHYCQRRCYAVDYDVTPLPATRGAPCRCRATLRHANIDIARCATARMRADIRLCAGAYAAALMLPPPSLLYDIR